MDQWPILEPRLFVSKEIVLEQLSLSHLESLSSIHITFYHHINNNKYFFVIQKKSGKYRLLQDLRAVNEHME